jgi:Flp pilus assembly protein TadG
MRKMLRRLFRPAGRRCPTHAQQGQSLVETALVLPILILLLAIVVDAGRLFDASIVLVQAAREGARYATVRPNPTVPLIQDLVVTEVTGSGTNITHMANFSRANVTVSDLSNAASTEVTVTVSYDFPLWFGGVLGLDTVTITRQGVAPMWLPNPTP